jgi:hypothetical protein
VTHATAGHPVGAEITYGEFGVQLFRQVLHERRVEDSVAAVLGNTIDLGPFGAGPGRFLAKVRALGTIGRPRAEAVPSHFVAYRVVLPVSLAFDLDLGVDLHRFRAEMQVPLRLTARAAAPLTIVWDISPPAEEELEVRVEVDKRRTAVLRRVAGIDAELRRFMVRYVTRELQKEHVRRATRLHLGEAIDAAWPLISALFLEPGATPETTREATVAGPSPPVGGAG